MDCTRPQRCRHYSCPILCFPTLVSPLHTTGGLLVCRSGCPAVWMYSSTVIDSMVTERSHWLQLQMIKLTPPNNVHAVVCAVPLLRYTSPYFTILYCTVLNHTFNKQAKLWVLPEQQQQQQQSLGTAAQLHS